MSWRMRIVHTTGYRYASPVTQSYNEVRLTPRTDGRQNLMVNRIETTPSTRAYRYNDYWGTTVTAFDLHAPHTELKVVSSSVVETADGVEPVDTANWSDLRTEAVQDRFVELLTPTPYTPRDRELMATATRLRRGVEPAAAVRAACEWVHGQLAYRQGTTGVHTTAVEALRAGEGVCQDYAHLTLVLLRAMGIPARYVSGYLHTTADASLRETVRGESHAWIEAWTGGWWGFDPTNDLPIGPRHAWVAVGRDYADVAPLKGIYSGGESSALDVTVDITRLA